MPLYAGRDNDYEVAGTNSLAREIEVALVALVPEAAEGDVKQRKKLVLAIARGVIEHLRKNESAFTVHIPNSHVGHDLPIDISVTPST